MGSSAVEAYWSAVPDDARPMLEELRRIVMSVAPAAVESFSYGMPTFKIQGRQVAHIAAWKNHCALYGMDLAAHVGELAGYDTSKGTLRLPLGKPLPVELLRTLIAEKVAETKKPRRTGRGPIKA